MNRSTQHVASITFLVAGLGVALVQAGAAPIEFNRDIRPILSDNCFACHGPDATHRKARLRLDLEEGAKADLGNRGAVVPGKPDQSELIARIHAADPEDLMPPPNSGKALDAGEKELLRRWIESGAPWAQHWAYATPRRRPAPEVSDASWPASWIDRFIAARLDTEGLAPSPDADRITLIRRLSFDLTGLPPTPEEVRAFVEDGSDGAYERVVDRLLRSPAYGERMAMFWLDLVRYADTVGYHGDQSHSISPYRDWVIDAFNDNLPFDMFTRDQLAGDLVPGDDLDRRIASGYNRLLQTSHEGGVQAREYLAIYAADRVRNLSAVWLGATLGCAQCHDHKFDPYTSKDFYSMAAFFADIDEARHLARAPDESPTLREPEIEVLSRVERRHVAELREEEAALREQKASLSGEGATAPDEQIASLEERIASIEGTARRTMITRAIEPRPVRILPRGNWLDESGPLVEPAVPAFLGSIGIEGRATRLDLARWLTDADHGAGALTARVMANRFWYLLFGEGLARVLDDFGGQGEPPSHPELLDTLALEFVESGWDIKRMMKRLVMTRAYRQSSLVPDALARRDPDNRLLARQSRFRLPAEMIRDNALSISGLLVRDVGGPSVKPYQPEGYFRHLNFPPREYVADPGSGQWRRGVYVHWQRQYLHPMLKAFDAPSREECTARRPRSNTPLAALALLNDPSHVEAARVFAARMLREGGDSAESRLRHGFMLAVSRPPDEVETGLLRDLLREAGQPFRENIEAADRFLKVGLAPVPEGMDPAELAGWTMVARAILNLNETGARN